MSSIENSNMDLQKPETPIIIIERDDDETVVPTGSVKVERPRLRPWLRWLLMAVAALLRAAATTTGVTTTTLAFPCRRLRLRTLPS